MLIRRNYRVFRITGHPKLGNIKAFFFHFRRYSHAFRFIDAPEDCVGGTECPGSIQSCSHELAEELPGIAVEQTGDALTRVAEI